MEFSIERAALARMLGMFRHIIDTKPLVPIYGSLRLTVQAGDLNAADGLLTIAGAGRVVAATIQSTVPVTVIAPGDVLLPAARLADVVASFSDSTVRFVQKATQVDVLAGRAGRARLTPSGDVADFPSVSEPEQASTWNVEPPSSAFVAGLRRVLHAAASDDTRPMLNGVRVEDVDGILRLVTADGYRLSATHIDEGIPTRAMLLPLDTAKALLSLLPSSSDEPVVIRSDDGRVSFRCGPVACASSLIASEFPDYRRIVRASSSTVVRVKTTEALGAFGVARAMRPDGNLVHVFWQFGRLLVVSEHLEDGIAVGEAPATIVAGEPGVISVSAAYLKDALDALAGNDEVDLGFDGLASVQIEPVDATGAEIVMPMNQHRRPNLKDLPGYEAEVPDPVPHPLSRTVSDPSGDGSDHGDWVESSREVEATLAPEK